MKKILILLGTIFITSCSIDVDYHMPAARFATPETSGGSFVDMKLKGNAQLTVGTSQKITLGEVYSIAVFNIDPSVNTNASIDRSFAFGANAHLSLIERMDLYYRAVHDSPDMLGLKFQFIGDPEAASTEGVKMAIAAGYGSSDKSEGTLTVSNNGASQRDYSASIEVDAWDLNLISGYRTSKTALFYLNTFYSTYKTEGKLTSISFGTENVKGTSRSYGALFGMKYSTANERAYFLLELGATHARWEKQLDTTGFTSGLGLGIKF
ncbi:MAG: hypothetical protein CME70_16440 [Halobacteriovorax sp.]|nr:hypothetical protein [Halobacteriovorax sp.]